MCLRLQSFDLLLLLRLSVENTMSISVTCSTAYLAGIVDVTRAARRTAQVTAATFPSPTSVTSMPGDSACTRGRSVQLAQSKNWFLAGL